MKHLLFSTAIAVLLISGVKAQVTQAVNTPSLTNYVGFNNTSTIPLPILNIGDPRINISSNGHNKFAIKEIPAWYGLNGMVRSDVQRTTMGLHNETDTAWSMLHLWSGYLNPQMYRSWYNVGTSYTTNADFMYAGLLERPESGDAILQTDAVIAWGCQNEFDNSDNFRIIFLQPNANPDNQGLETMRITPWGNVGIGRNFNNNLQPWRRLEVNQRTDSAQFRISWATTTTEGLGVHAEFQVGKDGNLHIKPRNNGSARATAIGFLNGEASPPYLSGAISTRLDVGGLTRIRLLPDSVPTSLIMGYNIQGANNGVSDKFLGRLDFPNDNTQFLSGTGEWLPAAGGDFDWDTNGSNVWTGTGSGGFPAGQVGIGAGPILNAKLKVVANGYTSPSGPIGIWCEANGLNSNYISFSIFNIATGGTSAN